MASACVQRGVHAATSHCMCRYLLESELGDELGGDLVCGPSTQACSICLFTKAAAAVTSVLELCAIKTTLVWSQVVSLLTQTTVSPDDPAFADPTKFIGPVYSKEEADRWAPVHDSGRTSCVHLHAF